MIYWELFWSFCQIGVFCVGGGYASMPLIQQQVVNVHGWMTMSELINVFAISQMTPGPIGINAATFVGAKIAGPVGAVCATAGFVAPSVIIMLLLAKAMDKYGDLPALKGVLNGLRPAVIALIASAGVVFITLALWNREEPPFDFAATSYPAVALMIFSLILARSKKVGVIGNLTLSGIIGVVLGMLGFI